MLPRGFALPTWLKGLPKGAGKTGEKDEEGRTDPR